MKPSRPTLAMSQLKEYNFQRLSNLDPELGARLRAALPMPWFKVLRNAELPVEQVERDESPEAPEDTEPDTTTVLIYEEIGGSLGVSANEFVNALNEIETPNINIRLNSPGGALFDGITIYNALNAHPSRVTVYVDGIAASAASIVAMAGDEVVMMPGSQIMIHDAMGVITGNKADMDSMSKFLDRQSNNIASIYAYHTGDESEEAIKGWRAAMLDETWYMANEAVEAGLADKVYLKPKSTRGDGGPLEAEVEEDEEGEPVPPDQEEESTEDSMEEVTALLHRRHTVRNSKYGSRAKAPKPFMPTRNTVHNGFDVDAFISKAKAGRNYR